jgi:hypothetical protein
VADHRGEAQGRERAMRTIGVVIAGLLATAADAALARDR